LTEELHCSFLYILFFSQEKKLGDISFKLETKKMNLVAQSSEQPITDDNNPPKFDDYLLFILLNTK
jgi:hypothetical protein